MARIGRLELIEKLVGEIVVPPAVVREAFGEDPVPGWIRTVDPGIVAAAEGVLGPGEREAIALAEKLGARWLLLDDLPARRVAARRGLPVIGTLGVLLAAKSAGLLDAVAPLIQALEADGFRVSSEVRLAALAPPARGDFRARLRPPRDFK